MTTVAHLHAYLPPADQPTPQSPPYFKHQSKSSNASPDFRQAPTMNANNYLPTPNSQGDAGPHADPEGDVSMDENSYSQSAPFKRRRTSTSADSKAQTIAPSLRHHDSDGDDGMPDAVPPPVQPTIQELLSKPDVSPYYLVNKKPHAQSYPDMTDSLLDLYDLKYLVDKVARFDPAGAKKKLRKSYKGFIAGLSGKNEVEARTPTVGLPEDHFVTRLMMWPEEEWQNQVVQGRNVSQGLDMSKLRKGLSGMTKGEIPGFDASVLGLDDELPRKKTPQVASPAVVGGTPRPNGSTPGNASTASGGQNAEARHTRKKRRRYDEGSYEGYEGFEGADEVAVSTPSGVSSSGAGLGGGGVWDAEKKKKKRKKNPDVNSPGIGLNHHTHAQTPVQLYGR